MDKESIKEALQILEQANPNPNGYSAGEILSVLNIEIIERTKNRRVKYCVH